jgi:hypothetical protein
LASPPPADAHIAIPHDDINTIFLIPFQS